jgi:PKD repeat protein
MRIVLTWLLIAFITTNCYSQTITPSGPLTFCQGGNVTLTASAGTSYQWLNNGNPIPGATAQSYIATASGSYAVTINNGSPVTTSPATVIVNPNPVPSFTYTNNVCSGDAVPFNSTVAGGTAPFTYAWTFGGGGNETIANPAHIFNSFGCGNTNFGNTLTVTDVNGCIGTVTNAITIKQAPDVQLTDQNIFSPFNNCNNSPTPANPNYTITVNNATASACVTGFTLDWGDGSPVVNAPVFPATHTYTQLGAFNLTFTGTGANGCVNAKKYVVANQTNPDIGLGTVGPLESCNELDVNIIISSWQNNSPGTTYRLTYGDGTVTNLTHPINATNTNQTIIHHYDKSSCPMPGFPLSITASNGCRNNTFTGANIVIKTKPQAQFRVNTNPACTGQPVCFTNETIAGYYNNCSELTNYTWDFGDPASGPANTSTAANPCHTYSTPGNYTVTLTTSNPCGNSTISKQICVTSPPTPSFTTTPTDVCVSQVVQANNTSSTGTCPAASYTYQWSVTYAAGFCGTASSWSFANGTNANSINPAFTFNNPGIYTIRLVIVGSCTNTVATRTVNVKKPPEVSLAAIPNACGSTTICPAPVINNCGTAPLTYAWSFDGGAAGTSDQANPGCISFTSAGPHSVSLSVTNECGTTTVIRQFTINPSPNLTLPASASFCPGETTGAFAFVTTVPAPITWSNNTPGIGIPSSGTGDIAPFVTVNNGSTTLVATISVTSSSSGCAGQSSFTITVHPKPAAPVATPVDYCQNDVATPLTIPAVPGNTVLWYSSATGGAGSTTTPTPVTSATGTTHYYVSQQNPITGCESSRSLLIVNVWAIPVIVSNNAVNPTICSSTTGSIILTGLAPSTAYSIRYSKNNGAPTTVTLTSGTNGNIVINGLTAGIYSDVTVSHHGCISNIVGPFTLVDPNPPTVPAASNNGPKCAGESLSLTASSTVAGVTYAWTGPNGFSSTQQNPVINGTTVAAGGSYNVTVTVNGCTSLPASTDVVINPRPGAPVLSSNSPVCDGGTINLTATTNFPGVVTYSWTGPNGYTSTEANPVITNITPANAGPYSLTITATTGNCISPASTTSVIILPVPVIVSASYINPVGCGSANGSIILNGLTPSSAYIVRFIKDGIPVTANGIAGSTGILIIGGLSSGVYTDINVGLNGCQSNLVGPFTLADTAPFSVVGGSNSPLCENTDLVLNAHATATGSATYAWTGPNGFTSAVQNPVIPNAGVINSGDYKVTITINGCPASTSFTVSVSTRTIGGQTAPDATVCKGKNRGTITLSSHLGAVVRWEASINNGLTWAPIPNTTASLNYNNITQTTWYRAVVQNGPCPVVYSANTIITVITGVDAIRINPLFVTTCNHDTTIAFTSQITYGGTGNVRYVWYVNGQASGTSPDLTYRFSAPIRNASATEFIVRALAEDNRGCGDTSLPAKVIIHPYPYPEIQVTPGLVQDEPNTQFTFKDISPNNPDEVHTWSWFDRIAQIRRTTGFTYTFNEITSYKVNLAVINQATKCWAIDSVTIVIRPSPGTLFIPNAFYPNSRVNELRTFQVKGIGLSKYHLQIFDAWGKLVFETRELNADGSPKEAWNGTYLNSGTPLTQDVFTWRITEAEFKNGKQWKGMSYNGSSPKHFGSITLFR